MARDFTYEPENPNTGGAGTLARRDVPGSAPLERGIPGGELEPIPLRDTTFAKVGTKPILKRQEKILRKAADPINEIDILPTGEVYMSHVHVRQRLNNAFGPMGWALRPLTLEKPDTNIDQMYQRFALIANGRIVATAVGSAKYFPKSKRMDYADTAEAVKSNALTRCCKDLGIGWECWDRRWALRYRREYGVHVWIPEKVKQRDGTYKTETAARWRRIDGEPFQGEISPVKDSPNQDEWRKQAEGWIKLNEAESAKSKEVADRLRKSRVDAKGSREELQREMNDTRKASGQSGERSATAPANNRGRADASTPASAEHVQHGAAQVRAEDRPFRIRKCEIVSRKPNNILHKITMMNGAEYFTFSTTIYGEMQRHWASGDQIEIDKWESHEVQGRTYKHVVKDGWRILKRGMAEQPREPGQEG